MEMRHSCHFVHAKMRQKRRIHATEMAHFDVKVAHF
jgi:hypothetical protein